MSECRLKILPAVTASKSWQTRVIFGFWVYDFVFSNTQHC